ncbi:MAG: DUF2911 domain-containing protein [Tunicatimonas sp.]|uniref:DUF2911 domain-containing protein n=1 Tax=Tunicatimonas sp. TaxID=1940096 RepID=UPI003C716A1C
MISTLATSQDFRGLDKSPLDIAYYPDNFAHDREPGDEPMMKVTYSRPQLNGRTILGDKEPYGKVWRTGANEATEVKVFQDVMVGGKKLSAGTYSLFTIPNEDKWTVIFSSDLDYWGAYRYDESNDVLRTEATVSSLEESVEAFTIQFDDDAMRMAWGETMAELPISMSNN